MPRLSLSLSLILALAGLILFGQGAYIHAKALLAQVLLERAFTETVTTGHEVKPWSWADTRPIARIDVKRLHASAIVLAGSSGQALAFGPGHVDLTPDAGERGVAVYSAHRDTHFRFLKDVAIGDDIDVTRRDGKVFRYRVTATSVVRFDASGIDPFTDGYELVLSTCWPLDAITPGPLRYVVHATMLEDGTLHASSLNRDARFSFNTSRSPRRARLGDLQFRLYKVRLYKVRLSGELFCIHPIGSGCSDDHGTRDAGSQAPAPEPGHSSGVPSGMPRRPISFADASQSLMDAAMDPLRWDDAMETIAQYAGANGALLLQVKGRGPGAPRTRSSDEIHDVYFRDQWHLRDERTRGLPFIKTKGVFADQDFASREELEKSDYYRGFLAKFDCNWSAVIGFENADDEWCLIIQRGDRGGLFDIEAQNDLVRLAPHLNQAALLARNLAWANATGMIDAYESVGCACFLLDHIGKVIRHNAQAQSLIGDGLDLWRGTLKCSSPADNLALTGLIAAVRHKTAQKLADPLPAVLAHRPPKRPLVIHAVGLSGLACAIFSPAKSILLVTDTEKRPSPTPADLLQKLFKLTLTEIALLSHLEQEIALPAAAEIMGISFETARSHLKRIFSKTGTSRQTDLLMLMRRVHRGIG